MWWVCEKRFALLVKGLVYETVSYFTVISVVSKEVVVVSAYLLSMILRALACKCRASAQYSIWQPFVYVCKKKKIQSLNCAVSVMREFAFCR